MREPIREKPEQKVEQIQQRYSLGEVKILEDTPDKSIKRAFVRANHAMGIDEGRPGFTIRGYQVGESALREEIATLVGQGNAKTPFWYVNEILDMPVLDGYEITESILENHVYGACLSVAEQMGVELNQTLTGKQHVVLVKAKSKPVCLCIATPLPWGDVNLYQVWSENIIDTSLPLHVGVVTLTPETGTFLAMGRESDSV